MLKILLFLLISSNVNGKFVKRIPEYFVTTPQLVAGCRANCLDEYIEQFENTLDIERECRNSEDCYVCWQYCRVLYNMDVHSSLNICDSRDICSGGCKYSCQHFKIQNTSKNNLRNALRRLEIGRLKY